jgi:uncharacterized membrane protein
VHDHGSEVVGLGPLPPRARRWLLAVLLPFFVATLVGLVVLWPPQDRVEGTDQFTADTVTGEVVGLVECPRGFPADCVRGDVQLSDGGEVVEAGLPYGDNTPRVDVGDQVVLAYAPQAPPDQQYVWYDFDRSNAMLALVVVFALAVVFLSRWQGVGSLIGLAVSLGVVFLFVLPAIAHGENPVLVAVTGAALIMTLVLYISHGINAMTSVALIGTLAALALTAGLGLLFTDAARFTGLSDDSNRVLLQVLPEVEFEGLLLAGLIIGALGVLDDVTVTQAAAVWELTDADRGAPPRAIFASAMRIGRAHVAATVNTLVLAYTGAALPLLLGYSAVEANLIDVGLTDGVATEMMRGMVGSLGLIAAVPITTAVAVAVAAAIVARERTTAPPIG